MNIKIILNGATNLLIKRYMGPFWIRRRWLKKTQWISMSELEKIQLMLLKRLVRHCYSTVPYYKQLMDDRGIAVESIRNIDDIKQFPILSKNDVQEAGTSIISTKMPMWTLHKARTGGSTGSPMKICRNVSSIGNEHAFVRRQWDWAGIGFCDRCAYLSGRVVAQPENNNTRLYTYDPFMKELILSTYHLSPATVMEYAELIRDYGVQAIIGYPSAVFFLAKICLDAGFELNLKAALTSSETLTSNMRETISQAFKCRVYDYYGGAERVVYIHTCDHGNYHIIPEYGYTELISADKYGNEHYKVVSTGFWNMAMPLIRYDTGDVIVKSIESCNCGRNFPVIKSIVGRDGDIIQTPSGNQLGVTIVIHLMYVICGANNILETQFIQNALDHLTVEYVPGKNFSNDDFQNIKNHVVQYLPQDIKVDFKQVKAVKRASSGKIRPVVSKITPKEVE